MNEEDIKKVCFFMGDKHREIFEKVKKAMLTATTNEDISDREVFEKCLETEYITILAAKPDLPPTE